MARDRDRGRTNWPPLQYAIQVHCNQCDHNALRRFQQYNGLANLQSQLQPACQRDEHTDTQMHFSVFNGPTTDTGRLFESCALSFWLAFNLFGVLAATCCCCPARSLSIYPSHIERDYCCCQLCIPHNRVGFVKLTLQVSRPKREWRAVRRNESARKTRYKQSCS